MISRLKSQYLDLIVASSHRYRWLLSTEEVDPEWTLFLKAFLFVCLFLKAAIIHIFFILRVHMTSCLLVTC